MAFDFLDFHTRARIIQDIKSEENKQRKAKSLRQFEIFQDRLHQYVVDYLRQQFSLSTVREMPVVSSINLAKRIVTQEASLYKTRPTREFNAEEKELEQIEQHYEDISVDAKMLKSNQYFKLQNQNLLMIVPKEGKLVLRVLLPHHYDVVPDPDNPERALAYIISAFDKSFYIKSTFNAANPTGYRPATDPENPSDGVNQVTGDQDDYKSVLEKYIFWSKDYNFIMDGSGKIISPAEDVESPLAPMQIMPFIDIANDKDFEYFVRQGHSLSDFTVQYNGALSDLGNVVKMQGWAQAWLKGSKELMPENIQIGPNFILKLPIDPTDQVQTDFGFSNPSPDVAGSIQYVEMLLSNFLTSRGQSPKVVSGKGESDKFSSGVERLLAMIERFDASQADMEIYRDAEESLFEIIKAWNNTLIGTGVLEITSPISEDTNVEVKYAQPQAIQSRAEQLAAIQLERELGLKSRTQAIEELYDVDTEKAKMIIDEIDSEEIGISVKEEEPEREEVSVGEDQGVDPEAVGSQPDDQP